MFFHVKLIKISCTNLSTFEFATKCCEKSDLIWSGQRFVFFLDIYINLIFCYLSVGPFVRFREFGLFFKIPHCFSSFLFFLLHLYFYNKIHFVKKKKKPVYTLNVHQTPELFQKKKHQYWTNRKLINKSLKLIKRSFLGKTVDSSIRRVQKQKHFSLLST